MSDVHNRAPARGPLYVVRDALGHASVATTQVETVRYLTGSR